MQRCRMEQRNERDDRSGRAGVGAKDPTTTKAGRHEGYAAAPSSKAMAVFLKSGRYTEAGTKAASKEPSKAERGWPKERFDAKIQSHKMGPLSSQEDKGISLVGKSTFTTGIAGTSKTRLPAASFKPLAIGNKELKRNLNAATVVMQEEKASSVGSSSSSGRSSLSHEELGGVASRALQLSKGREDTQATRRRKSPLGVMMAEKRTGKAPGQPASSGLSKADITGYGTAQRLSDRLTRAERFTALKKSQQIRTDQQHQQKQDDESSMASSTLTPVKKPHPVFGYSQQRSKGQSKYSNTDDTTASPCVQRSKQLSKIIEEKAAASHHATSSLAVAKQKNRVVAKRTAVNCGQTYHERKNAPSTLSQPHHEEAPQPSKQFATRSTKAELAPIAVDSNHRRQYGPPPSPDTKNNRFSHLHRHFHYPSTTSNVRTLPKSLPSTDIAPHGRLDRETLAFLALEKKLLNDHSTEEDRNNTRNPLVAEESGELTESGSSAESIFKEHAWQGRASTGDRSSTYKPYVGDAQNERRPGELSISISSTSEYGTTSESAGATSSDDLDDEARQQLAVEVNADYPTRHTLLKRRFEGQTNPKQRVHETPIQPDLQRQDPMMHPAQTKLSREEAIRFNNSFKKLSLYSAGSSTTDQSSVSAQDPLQWFHSKYGVSNPKVGVKNHSPANATLPVSTQAKLGPESPVLVKVKEDEGDDIFDGLDDETTGLDTEINELEEEEEAESVGSNEAGIDKPPDHSRQLALQKPPVVSRKPAAAQRKDAATSPEERQRKAAKEKRRPELQEAPQKRNRKPFQVIPSQTETKGDKNDTDESSSTKALSKDAPKTRGLCWNPDDAMEVEDDFLLEYESLGENENEAEPPPPNRLVDFGYAFVDTIQNSCAVPGTFHYLLSFIDQCCCKILQLTRPSNHNPPFIADKIHEVSTCAVDAKIGCIDRLNDAFGKRDVKIELLSKDYEQKSGEDGNGDPAASDRLEQRLESSDSSISQDTLTKVKSEKNRQDAQEKLFKHVEKAMKLVYSKTGGLGESDSTGPQPTGGVGVGRGHGSGAGGGAGSDGAPLSPSSNLSAKLSFEQRSVLEGFSTQLKNEGVEVLKLGRRNRWQVRYLTVSREVTSLDSDDDVGQCPKALLWPKQRKPPTCSVNSIKDNGRGGVLFEHLKQIRTVESNEHFHRQIPRKLKEMFPTFEGIELDYLYQGGERQLNFCFKNKLEAQAFKAAVLIIKEATDRGQSTESSEFS